MHKKKISLRVFLECCPALWWLAGVEGVGIEGAGSARSSCLTFAQRSSLDLSATDSTRCHIGLGEFRTKETILHAFQTSWSSKMAGYVPAPDPMAIITTRHALTYHRDSSHSE